MHLVRIYFLLLLFVFFVTGCLEIGYHDLTKDENANSNKTDKPTTNIGRDSEQTVSACSDGLDNDCNGYIDCDDNTCKNSADAQVHAYCHPQNG